MEIDYLKTLWHQIDAEPTGTQNISALLQKQSNNAIAKMKRNLRIESFFVVVTFSFIIGYYFFIDHGKFSEVSWVYLALGGSYLFYYYKKNRLLNNMECVACHVKSNMERQLKILSKYVKFYLWSGTLLVPIVLIFFVYLLGYKIPAFKENNFLFTSAANPLWKVILYWLFISVVTMIPLHFINKWYVKKLYGNHIKKLQSILNEMEEGPNEF